MLLNDNWNTSGASQSHVRARLWNTDHRSDNYGGPESSTHCSLTSSTCVGSSQLFHKKNKKKNIETLIKIAQFEDFCIRNM